MTMWQVVDHTPDQLGMIYDAHRKERATEKLMDLDILCGVVSSSFAKEGDWKAEQAVQRVSQRLLEQAGPVKAEDHSEQAARNRKAHIAVLMGMGAQSK